MLARVLVVVALVPLGLQAQLPNVRDLAGGTSLGKLESIGQVIELSSGQVLASESESGAIWSIAPGASRAERLKLSGSSAPTAGLAWAGGDSAYTFATRAMMAYPLSATGKIGTAIGEAPEGAAMFMLGGSGAGSAMAVDASGRVYQVERDQTGGNLPSKLVSRGKEGSRTEATLLGDAVARIRIGAGGAEPTRLFQPGDSWAVTPDGALAVVRAEPYRVEWYRNGQRVAEGPVVPFTPVATATADSVQWIESRRKAMERMPMISGAGGIDGLSVVLPPTKPAFVGAAGGVRTATDGTLWVMLHGPAGSKQGIWDHFDRQGRLLERVRFPAGYLVRGFGRGVAYASADGELYRVPLQ